MSPRTRSDLRWGCWPGRGRRSTPYPACWIACRSGSRACSPSFRWPWDGFARWAVESAALICAALEYSALILKADLSAQAAGEDLTQLPEVVQPLGSFAKSRDVGDFGIVERAVFGLGLEPLTGRD